MIVACFALGLDCLLARRGSKAVTEPRPLTLDRGLRWLTIVAMTGLGCAALVGNWFRAAAPDAQSRGEIVVRVSKYGGTYFDNAVLNRGPLEQWAHSLASHISTYDGYWYTISAFVAIVSAVVAYSMYRTVVAFGAVGELGLAAAIVGFVHFALGSSAYAGVFFVRNLITMLLVVVWVIMLADRPWRTTRSRDGRGGVRRRLARIGGADPRDDGLRRRRARRRRGSRCCTRMISTCVSASR